MIAETVAIFMMAVAFAAGALVGYVFAKRRADDSDYDLFMCVRCPWVGRRREMLDDGATCPRCKLVQP